jgi:plastocyanin
MRVLAIASALLLIASACGDDDNSGPNGNCQPDATTVCLSANLFDPEVLTISAGTSVRWINGDGTAHTTTSNPANPAGCPGWGQNLAGGVTSTPVEFVTGGISCQYYCSIHATATSGAMRGTITVQ